MIKPYYDKGGITIYNADCIQTMSQLEDKSLDLIFSDYPFNCQDGRRNYEQFVEETEKLFSQKAKPVCNLVVVNCPAKIFTTAKFFNSWTLINGIALLRRGSLGAAWHFRFQHNYALLLNKGGIKNKWNGTKIMNDKAFDSDVMLYQNGYRGKGSDRHPQAMPLPLVEKLVHYLANKGDTVLDPFMGSGTTLVAAKKLGMKAIGIELNEKYCAMAVRRLERIDGESKNATLEQY